jgi:O-antigen/teichoic acid export membrane protein
LLSSLVSDSGVYGLGLIATRFIGVLLLPLYTRLFPPDQYGYLDLILTTSTILALICELQLVSGVARGFYEAKGAGRLNTLLGTSLAVYITGSLLSTFVCWCLWERYSATTPYGPVSWRELLPVLIGLLPTQAFWLFQVVLRYDRRKWQFVTFSFLDVILSSSVALVLVLACGLRVSGVLWGLAVSKLLLSLVLYTRYYRSVIPRFNRDAARELLTYGVPLLPSVLMSWAQTYAGRYMLAGRLPMCEVGLFAAAARLSAAVTMIDLAFRQAWDPLAIKLFGETASEPVLRDVSWCYLMFILAGSSVVGLFGEPLVRVVAGHAYARAGVLVPFLAAGMAWNGAGFLLGLGNLWERRTYHNAGGMAVGIAVNLTLIWFLAPRYGLITGGIAYMIGSLTATSLVFVTAQRNHYIPHNVGLLSTAAIASLMVAFCSYALQQASMFTSLPWPYQFAVRAGLAIGILALAFASARGTVCRLASRDHAITVPRPDLAPAYGVLGEECAGLE